MVLDPAVDTVGHDHDAGGSAQGAVSSTDDTGDEEEETQLVDSLSSWTVVEPQDSDVMTST